MANCNKNKNKNKKISSVFRWQVSKELCSLVLWASLPLCVCISRELYNKMMMFSMLLREIRQVLLSSCGAARVARVARVAQAAPSSKCQVFLRVIKAAQWKVLQQYVK